VIEDLANIYNRQLIQEKFATLVAARVNDILAGTAKEYKPEPPAGGAFLTKAQEDMLFADVIAKVVCATIKQGEEK
jgi:hypothetical protein